MTVHILLIGDELQNLTSILTQAGYTVTYLADGTADLPAVAADAPDLILCAAQLMARAGLTGQESFLAAKSFEKTAVIYAISQPTPGETQGGILDAHSEDYLYLPIADIELLGRIKATLRWQQAARLARQRANQQTLIADLGQAALQGLPLADLYTQALHNVVRGLQTSSSAIYELTDAGQTFTLTTFLEDTAVHRDLALTYSITTEFITAQVLRTGQAITLYHLDEETNRHLIPRLQKMKLKSGIWVPMMAQERPFGVLGVFSRRPRVFSDADIGFVQSLANVLATAVHRQQIELSLQHSETRFRDIFTSVRDAIVIESLQGQILDVNDYACQLYGYSRAEMLRRHVIDLVPPSFHHTIVVQPERTTPLAHPVVLEAINRRADGSDFPVEVTIQPHTLDGQPVALTIVRDLTTAKQAQIALAQSEKMLQTLMQTAPITIGLARNRHIEWVNQAIYPLLGYLPAELIGQPTRILYASDGMYQEAGNLLYNPLRSGKTTSGETLWRHKQGHLVNIWMSATAVDLSQEMFTYVVTALDITGRKQAEEQIARLATVVEQAAETVVITDLDGHIVYVNPQFTTDTGYTPEETLGQNPRILKSGFHDQTFYQELWETITQGHTYRGRIINKRKDGRFYYEDAAIFPIRDDQGQIINYAAVKRNVTTQVQAEEQTQKLLQRYMMLNQFALNVGLITDLTGIYTAIYEFTKRLMDVAGLVVSFYDATTDVITAGFAIWDEELVNHHHLPALKLDRIGPSTQSQVILTGKPVYVPDLWELMPQVSTAYVWDFDTGVTEWPVDPSSDYETARSAIYVPLQIGGQVMGVLQVQSYRQNAYTQEDVDLLASMANMAAVTIQNARLLQETQQQAQQVEQLVGTMPDGIILLDENGRILVANPPAHDYLQILSPDASPYWLLTLRQLSLADLLEKAGTDLGHNFTVADRNFNVKARAIQPGTAVNKWVLLIRDTTNERQVQERANEQDRLAAVGQLAAGIAHDFNNIMAVIVLYSQLALHEDLSQELHDRLLTIEAQSKRAADLIQQILDFSRNAVLERQPLPLTPFLKELHKLLQRTLPEHIRIDLAYDRQEYVINADPTRIQQTIMNLALNARDAMPNGGQLTLALAKIVVPVVGQRPLHDMLPGSYVTLTVTDTGTGIPEDIIGHIYEPFFTTKAPGKGSGLGLAQVYGIVKQHDGYITVNSRLEQGTTFTLYFPALKVAQTQMPYTPRIPLNRGKGQTILVVEDEQGLREAISASLEALNYQVIKTCNGLEALTQLSFQRSQIALILSDAIMPEMGGIALLHAVRQAGISIPFVILTGHTMETELDSLRAAGLNNWLLKPPNLHQLSQVIAGELG